MIIITGITIYKCEFCAKKLFSRSSMVKHEKFCSQNPVNWKACSSCMHLEETNVECSRYSVELEAQITFQAKAFYCKALNKHVYPTKVEKLGLLEKYPNTFANQIPMPKECPLYDDGLGIYFEY